MTKNTKPETLTLAILKANGWTVQIRHFRHVSTWLSRKTKTIQYSRKYKTELEALEQQTGHSWEVNSNGGRTEVIFEKAAFRYGTSVRCLTTDTYSYKTGVALCLEKFENHCAAMNIDIIDKKDNKPTKTPSTSVTINGDDELRRASLLKSFRGSPTLGEEDKFIVSVIQSNLDTLGIKPESLTYNQTLLLFAIAYDAVANSYLFPGSVKRAQTIGVDYVNFLMTHLKNV